VTTARPVVLAITGASGAPYGVRLLDVLARHRIPVWLIVSSHGMRLLDAECGIASLDTLREATGGDWSSVVPFSDGDRRPVPSRPEAW
jgi:4-hydroxy-3-polyprenylbenzoate decarboxylase